MSKPSKPFSWFSSFSLMWTASGQAAACLHKMTKNFRFATQIVSLMLEALVWCVWEIYDAAGAQIYNRKISNIFWDLIFKRYLFSRTNHFQFPRQLKYFFLSAGVKFRRQHWLFLLICLLVFVIILSIYLPIAGRVDNIEVGGEVGRVWGLQLGEKM